MVSLSLFCFSGASRRLPCLVCRAAPTGSLGVVSSTLPVVASLVAGLFQRLPFLRYLMQVCIRCSSLFYGRAGGNTLDPLSHSGRICVVRSWSDTEVLLHKFTCNGPCGHPLLNTMAHDRHRGHRWQVFCPAFVFTHG